MFARKTVVENKVARVMIAIQNVKTDVDSFVVPDEYTRHLVIIRQDFRLQDHVVMIKRGNRLIFNESSTFGRKKIATGRDIGFCDVPRNSSCNLVRLRKKRIGNALH